MGKFKKRIKNDLLGQKVGKLIILEPTEDRDSNGSVIWHCKCECGNDCYISRDHLKKGDTLSCGCLKSKGEKKIEQILKDNNINYEKQKTFQGCKDINLLRFDFYINNEYIIEFDGKQHFIPVKYWGGEENLKIVKKHDNIKNNYCKEHKIPLIRIPYTQYENLCLEDLLLETTQFLLI